MSERTIDWWLVGATGALVIVGLVGMILTCRQMEKQLNVMKEQNRAFQQVANRAIRPLAIATIEHPGYSVMQYCIGPADTVGRRLEGDFRLLPEVPIGSDGYKAITFIQFGVDSLVLGITNLGRTPLYITAIVAAAVTEAEWVGKHNKSPESLCSEAMSMDLFSHLETDYFILPDSTRRYKEAQALRTMPSAEFKDCLDSQCTVLFYPYIYMQYRDLYDNTYDLLFMLLYQFAVRRDSDPDGTEFADVSVKSPITEKHGWDILLPAD